MRRHYKRLVVFLGSKTFFGIVMAIFLLSSLWFALSAHYPMAFDEEYHLGLIKLHTLQWNPIFTHQPTGIAQYGALTTDPSYLFHWLMSFPYRLMSAMKMKDMQIVVILRYINVVLFAASLIYFRKLLLKTKASSAAINMSLLFFILLPVVPFLAATINYDNLQNLLLALGLLYLVRFKTGLQKKSFDISAFVGFMSIGLLGSLVKFTFLPFLTAFAVYLLYAVIRFKFTHKKLFLKSVKKDWLSMSRLKRYVLATVFLFSCWLFLNSYGVNIVKYHNPVPQCGQVVDYQRCQAYSPWYRNYLSAVNNKPVNPNPVLYTGQWIGGMFNRLVFTINGKGPVDNYQNFVAPLMGLAFILLSLGSVVLVCRYGKRLLQADGTLALLLFVALVYTASVWGRNYHDYLHLKQGVAINGRYLIPILPPVFLLATCAYQQFLKKRERAKAALLGVSFFLFLQGGGVSSFIYYSSDSWYLEGNPTVRTINHAAKKVITPLFINHYIKALDFYQKIK